VVRYSSRNLTVVGITSKNIAGNDERWNADEIGV
jgi:hypothetical protein